MSSETSSAKVGKAAKIWIRTDLGGLGDLGG